MDAVPGRSPLVFLGRLLLIFAVALIVILLLGTVRDVEAWPLSILCLVPASILLSLERALGVDAAARRRFQAAGAQAIFFRDYLTLFAALAAGAVVAAAGLTTYYNHILDTASDPNDDLRVSLIWLAGYLLVPLVLALLLLGTRRLIRRHYGLSGRASWSVLLISLLPDLVLLALGVILYLAAIVPLIEWFGRAVG